MWVERGTIMFSNLRQNNGSDRKIFSNVIKKGNSHEY